MSFLKAMAAICLRSMISILIPIFIFNCTACNGDKPVRKGEPVSGNVSDRAISRTSDEYQPVFTMLVLPKNPAPGEPFRIMAVVGKNIGKYQIRVNGASGSLESPGSTVSDEMPYWRIDKFGGSAAGKYRATLISDGKEVSNTEFEISSATPVPPSGLVWKTQQGWDSRTETIYSAWINALFHDCDENSSWPALDKVTQDQEKNFLYNYLSLDEDDPDGKTRLIMQPDCADNPFFLRAYFAWKLGLPFGYHLCDRGSLVKNPRAGEWITNESPTSKINPVLAFNSFLRKVADGVHSGTARTALDDEKSDYYPVPLERNSLRPGTVYADPYGHTLILIGWVSQTNDHPGMLLAVDAQPDGTVGIKRFWKGNFLFNTTEVIGEPGFKAFRPILLHNGALSQMQNKSLSASSGLTPWSLQQRKMKSDLFYHTMERLINPEPLDPESALLDQLQALHEQLKVRITSVANGEAYFKSHPGAVIPMPSSAAGIFLAGGQWENFSTPNRDLRLLIAMDAVIDFPELIVRSPGDFNISKLNSPEQVRKKLQSMLDQKGSELYISYTRTDGKVQKLTIGELLERRDAFEMAYNPNDGIEIRWGAPENSDERAASHRHAPASQLETMRKVRVWFHNRLHPPT